MIDKIKSAIEELEFDMECGEFYNPSMADSVKLAIRSLQAWEEVLNELKNMRDIIWQDTDDEQRIVRANAWDKYEILGKAIDIINQHLAEIEE